MCVYIYNRDNIFSHKLIITDGPYLIEYLLFPWPGSRPAAPGAGLHCRCPARSQAPVLRSSWPRWPGPPAATPRRRPARRSASLPQRQQVGGWGNPMKPQEKGED